MSSIWELLKQLISSWVSVVKAFGIGAGDGNGSWDEVEFRKVAVIVHRSRLCTISNTIQTRV